MFHAIPTYRLDLVFDAGVTDYRGRALVRWESNRMEDRSANTSMECSLCAVIPTRNHWRALPAVVRGMQRAGLHVLIVDDGSNEPAATAIAALHDPGAGVCVTRIPINGGKGVAVMEGFRLALAAGYTHAVQADADGQHDLDALPRLLAEARTHPDALVSGAPIFDESAPAGRRIGRWITHLCVFLETLSFRITDAMCGFRVYPLAITLDVLNGEHLGRRMDFDTDIMVRLFWRGVPPIMTPVQVTYPEDNISNFEMLSDNFRITQMHTRLIITMLLRLPSLLKHRPPHIVQR
jgi:glycosyltransferase involved in cell wall biosynthesis